MATYIYAKAFYFEDEVKGPGTQSWITELSSLPNRKKPESGATIIDYGNYQIAPGLVDTHIHGFKGADVMDNDVEALHSISEGLPSCGLLLTTNNLNCISRVISGCLPNCRR